MTSPQTRTGGPPPQVETRHHHQQTPGAAGAQSAVSIVHAPDPALVETAIHLVRTLAEQAEAELAADREGFRDGYTLGYRAGWEIGYRHAHHEIARQQRAAAERIVRACLTALAAEEARGQTRPQLPPLADVLTERILGVLAAECTELEAAAEGEDA